MKKIKTLFAVGFLAILTSCGTTQQTTTKNTTAVKQENNRGRSNQDNIEARTKTETSPQLSTKRAATSETVRNVEQRTKTDNSPQLSTGRAVSSETVRNIDATDKARIQKMYSSINMNEEQVARFENEWKNSMGNWKRSNRNKTMNSFERVEYQDQILKNILDESQFDAYQEWARENPLKD